MFNSLSVFVSSLLECLPMPLCFVVGVVLVAQYAQEKSADISTTWGDATSLQLAKYV